jgi:hypothetical protein
LWIISQPSKQRKRRTKHEEKQRREERARGTCCLGLRTKVSASMEGEGGGDLVGDGMWKESWRQQRVEEDGDGGDQ